MFLMNYGPRAESHLSIFLNFAIFTTAFRQLGFKLTLLVGNIMERQNRMITDNPVDFKRPFDANIEISTHTPGFFILKMPYFDN